ncbi:MAG: c-type cytochrome domain-containing protein [Candidatus Hydrogenedentota bacterium]
MSIVEFLANPATRHAMVVHAPIVLCLLGVPLVLLALILPRRRNFAVWAVVVYALAAGCAYFAMKSGEDAMNAVPSTMAAEVWDDIEAHQDLGEAVWIAALVTALLLLVGRVLPIPAQREKGQPVSGMSKVRFVMVLLALLSSAATAGIAGLTAHRGGVLVYLHGVGTAPVMQAQDAGTTPAEDADSELPEGQDTVGALPQAPPAETEEAAEPEPAAPAESTAEEDDMPDVEEAAPIESTDEEETTPAEPDTDEAEAEPEGPANTEQTPADAAEDAEAANQVSFEEDIQPVLAENCYGCHESPDPKSSLDLTDYAQLRTGGDKAGAPVVPGNPGGSAIIQYVQGDRQPQMPYRKDPLDEETVDLLRAWIAQGAPHPDAPAEGAGTE